jgi:hypothetical protein
MGIFSSTTTKQLKSEIVELKKVNDELLHQIKNLEEKLRVRNENATNIVNISNEAVTSFIDQMIRSEHVNISYLPDYVEKSIYTNILTIILGILENVLGTTELRLLSHVITFNITPESNE